MKSASSPSQARRNAAAATARKAAEAKQAAEAEAHAQRLAAIRSTLTKSN